MNRTIIPGIILAAILLLFGIVRTRDAQNRRAISEWVAAHDDSVRDIDHRPFRTGPFIPLKSAMVYRVTTSRTNYWFRFYLVRSIYAEGMNGEFRKVE